MSASPKQHNPSFDLPELYDAAEERSEASQHVFYYTKGAELIALAVAAFFGFLGDGIGRAGPFISLAMFLLALGLQISKVEQRSQRSWYDARAAAESIKSASWQYAVGGEAFRKGSSTADDDFLKRLHDILASLNHLNIGPANSVRAGVTDSMRSMRYQSQTERHHHYRTERIEDQVRWYRDNSQSNRRQSRIWWVILVCVESGAVLAGLLRAIDIVQFDLLGLLATMAAGIVAWVQAKSYTELAESYAVTSHEIGLVAQSVHDGVTEAEWAQMVHDAEAAFSREHTMWLARKQGARTAS